MKINELTIVEAIKQLQDKKITALDLTKACLERIKQVDKKTNTCLAICEQEALAAAAAADERIAAGEKSELLGIPFVVKDNILTKGIKTTAASKILENYTAPFDATIISRLKEAGAVLLAKANLDEFGHGASGENSAFGATYNPWNLERVSGGSSSGSAAAVISDMCLFALGTDTGGSVRCPASFCGVVGLKPTYGRSSRFGLISMTSSTDVPGVLAKTVEDSALVLQVMAGKDARDPSSVDVQVPDYTKTIKGSIKGLKIGLPDEYFTDDLDKNVRTKVYEAIDKLKSLGATTVLIKLPSTKYAVPVYYIITPSEISSNLARFDGIRFGMSDQEAADIKDVYIKSRSKGLGKEVKRRIMIGTYALSAGYRDAYYLQAQKVRTKIKEEMDNALQEVDCILTPTQPTTAFKAGAHASDPVQMYLEDIFVSGAALAGLPAMSIPCGFVDGMPVGMQLIGSRFSEEKLFKIGYEYEQTVDFRKQKPSLEFGPPRAD